MDNYIIKLEDDLIRRIPRVPSHLMDGKPTSAVFKLKPGEDGVSVDILSLTTIEKSIKNPEKEIAGIIKAEIPLKEGCDCIHDPIPNNDAHALIKGVTKSISKKLALHCRLVDLNEIKE